MAARVFHSSHCWTLARTAMTVLPNTLRKDFRNAARTAPEQALPSRWCPTMLNADVLRLGWDTEGRDSCEIQNAAELFNMPAISPCVASATLAV